MTKKISILGDSISTFAGFIPENFAVYYEGERCEVTSVRSVGDTWWMQVIERLEGQLGANASYSGSMVEGAGFPAGSSAERVAALACDEGSAPDLVLVFMGINDYGWGGADAQAAGRGNALPEILDLAAIPPRVAGLTTPDAADHFQAAYSLLLARVRETYPQAEVWCCTLVPGRVTGREVSTFAYRVRAVPFDAYNDAIRTAAHAQGCQVADTRALGRDYDALDGTHPTALGMRQLAAMVLQSMGISPDGEFAEAFNQAPQSQEICHKPSCIGCEHAASTGNKWLLVCNEPRS